MQLVGGLFDKDNFIAVDEKHVSEFVAFVFTCPEKLQVTFSQCSLSLARYTCVCTLAQAAVASTVSFALRRAGRALDDLGGRRAAERAECAALV